MVGPKTIRRDSAILLVLLAVGGLVLGTPLQALSVAAGGLVVLINFMLISRLVERMASGEGSGAALGLGMALKTALSLGLLYGLLQVLDPLALAVGLGTVMLAMTVRFGLSAFAAPTNAQEA